MQQRSQECPWKMSLVLIPPEGGPAHPCSHSLSNIGPWRHLLGDNCSGCGLPMVVPQSWAAWSQSAMVFPSDSPWWFCAELVMKSPISMAALHISAMGCENYELTFLISPPSPLQVLMETFGVLLETDVEKGKAVFLLMIKTGARIWLVKRKQSIL